MIFDINLTELSDEDLYAQIIKINERIGVASAGGASPEIIYQMQDMAEIYRTELTERQFITQYEQDKTKLEATIESDPQFAPKIEQKDAGPKSQKKRKRLIT